MLHKPELVTKNIDLEGFCETERKFLPLHPEQFTHMRRSEESMAIEQVYLSSPDEPFNLRLRELVGNNGIQTYEATLKDRGKIGLGGLKRLEVSTPVSPELYTFYKSESTPILRKIRAEPVPKVVIDFYEDGSVQVESEDDEQWQIFTSKYGDSFTEITGALEGDNESRAYDAHRLVHGDQEHFRREPDAMIGKIINEVLDAKRASSASLVVHIGGRSGSGKSTIVRELAQGLDSFGIKSCTLSTDDYHRGASWLTSYNGGQPWQHWDDEVVYDTATMAQDLEILRAGQSIVKREIDWKIVEPRATSLLHPADVIIIEGIYAMKTEITAESDFTYELETPLATCIGRRLLRDIKKRPQFANPAGSLLYMLAEAEPAYRKQNTL